MSVRHISAKKAWGKLEERAVYGEKFGFIACIGVFLAAGKITRAEALAHLQDSHITREDLRKFREHTV